MQRLQLGKKRNPPQIVNVKLVIYFQSVIFRELFQDATAKDRDLMRLTELHFPQLPDRCYLVCCIRLVVLCLSADVHLVKDSPENGKNNNQSALGEKNNHIPSNSVKFENDTIFYSLRTYCISPIVCAIVDAQKHVLTS